MILCKGQLADRLVALFKDTDPANIDVAVAQAKGELAAEGRRAKRGDLERVFDSQIATLKARGCPEQILEALQNGKAKVLDHAGSIAIAEGNLAFAPVIPPLYLGYHGIVALVRHGGKEGYTYLNPAAITDVEDVPVGLYYVFDVEDGRALLGNTPSDADVIIRRAKRLRSTTSEVVSLGTHTEVLSQHYVDAVGSRFGSDGTPLLYLNGDRPRLFWVSLRDSDKQWGASSCGSRLEL